MEIMLAGTADRKKKHRKPNNLATNFEVWLFFASIGDKLQHVHIGSFSIIAGCDPQAKFPLSVFCPCIMYLVRNYLLRASLPSNTS